MKVKMKVEGVAELRKAFQELPKELHKGALRAAVSAGAKVVEDKAVANVRSKSVTGRLMNAIFRGRDRKESTDTLEVHMVGVSSKEAPYWRFIEFGTSKMPARPFLRPANESTKPEQQEAMRKSLSESWADVVAKVKW